MFANLRGCGRIWRIRSRSCSGIGKRKETSVASATPAKKIDAEANCQFRNTIGELKRVGKRYVRRWMLNGDNLTVRAIHEELRKIVENREPRNRDE